MPKYITKEPIKHDGKRYAPGASIELTKEEAERLRNSGALSTERPRAERTASDPSPGEGKAPAGGGEQPPSAGDQAEAQT